MMGPIQNVNPMMVVIDHFIRCNKEKPRGQHINAQPAAPGRHSTVNSRNKTQTKQTSSNASGQNSVNWRDKTSLMAFLSLLVLDSPLDSPFPKLPPTPSFLLFNGDFSFYR